MHEQENDRREGSSQRSYTTSSAASSAPTMSDSNMSPSFRAFLVDDMPSQRKSRNPSQDAMTNFANYSFGQIPTAMPPDVQSSRMARSRTISRDDEIPVLQAGRGTFGSETDSDEGENPMLLRNISGDRRPHPRMRGDSAQANLDNDLHRISPSLIMGDAAGDLENIALLQTPEDARANAFKIDKKKSTVSMKSSRLGTSADGPSTSAHLLHRMKSSGRQMFGSDVGSSTIPPIIANGPSVSRSRNSTIDSSILSTTQDESSYGQKSMISSHSDAQIDRKLIQCGWLNKQSDVWKAWKRRFFVLIKRTNAQTGEYTASLQYYKGSNYEKLRGEINLKDGPLRVRFVDASITKKPYCFEIARGDISFVCQGKSDEDVSAWVLHLQTLAGNRTNDVVPSTTASIRTSVMRMSTLSSGMDDRNIRIVAELRRILHTPKMPEATQVRDFIKSFDARAIDAMRSFHDFQQSLTHEVMNAHGDRILHLLEASGTSVLDDPPSLETVRMTIARHIEELLYLPLQEQIENQLRRTYQEDEAAISRKVRWLQGKDQTYFNIPLEHISNKEWRRPSKTLAQVTRVTLPSAKYDVLVTALQSIQSTYAEEHAQQEEPVQPLTTEEMQPIFTYVLSNSALENLLSLRVILAELNGSYAADAALDDGTALKLFTGAVEYISSVTIPAVLEDIFKDQTTVTIDGSWRKLMDFEPESTYRYGAVIDTISAHGLTAVGSNIARGHVLVTVNGLNVVLWPFNAIQALLQASCPPHRLAFIRNVTYFRILSMNKSLWNVALMHACQRGDLGSVQMLLANGADVNYVAHECYGNTPLHVAVSAKHYRVVSFLLQHGAMVRTLGEHDRNVLHFLGSQCTLPTQMATSPSDLAAGQIAQLLDADKQGLSTVERVVMIIRKLLAYNTPTQTVDVYGYTPLMLVAAKGYIDAVDMIVESTEGQIDLDARSWQRGMSALTLAAQGGHVEVVEALLDYGADVDNATLYGETAIHFAAALASEELVKLLIDHGCEIDAKTREGVTPLMVAAGKGLDIGKTDEDTASSRLDDTRLMRTIDILLQSGVDQDLVCKQYRCALHYASMYGGANVFDHLRTYYNNGSEEHMRDLHGKSAASVEEPLTSCEQQAEQAEDSDDDDEDDEREERPSDIAVLLSAPQDPESGVTLSEELATEKHEGDIEVIAGTFSAIADTLMRYERYRVEDVDALVWYCQYAQCYQDMLVFLQSLLTRHADTTRLIYIRRMVLDVVDKLVETIQHQVVSDPDVVASIGSFSRELFPFVIKDDPQCAQWLSSSLLPHFLEACRSDVMRDFQVLSFCDDQYSMLIDYLSYARQKDPNMSFVSDETFASGSRQTRLRRQRSLARNNSVAQNGASKRSESSTKFDRNGRAVFLSIDPNVLAHQITLLQHFLFSKLKASEVLVMKKSATGTPAYDRLRMLHNRISMWVVGQILLGDDPDQRAETLAHFIKIAGALLSPLQNLDGFMAVMNATNDSSIFRLKKTWNRLSAQSRNEWHDLKKYTENGARPLNKLTKEGSPPLIPYMGLVLQNMVAVHEFPDRVQGNLINFKKIRFIGELVRRLMRFQKVPYLLPLDKRIMDVICAPLNLPSPEACFARSLHLEPRPNA